MGREGRTLKILLLVGLLAAVAGVRAFRPPGPGLSLAPAIDLAGEGRTLRVLTWNVGEAYGGGDSRAQDGSLERIAQVIEMESPAVVALQELAGRGQLERLLRRLGGRYEGFVDESGETDRYTAVLARSRKVEFRVLSTTTGRNATAAIFLLPRSQLRICAVSVHADAWDPEARARYARELVDWGRRQDFDVVFLAGDFNFSSGADGGGGSLFSSSQATDTETYAYLMRHFRDLGRDGGETALLGRRIDYVFSRGGSVEVKRVDVLKGQRAGRMDHNPLVVDVLIPKPMILTRR